ncbi:MAG: hypothetical protein PHI50_04220 [Alphaproteobacteria bacterium]|nr:hypothetical protein [Alphaproteobacteria bacterium]
MTSVKNLNGTSNRQVPSGYSSWLDFWEKKAGKKARECSACTSRSNLVGAHVMKAYSSDDKWYIVPLCSSCNNKSSTEIFSVYEELVPVNQK